METYQFEILRVFFLVTTGLVALVWRMLSNRIAKIEIEQDRCPFPNIQSDISTIKNDIKWLKDLIEKKL